MVQIENCNNPFLDALSHYDDGQDLSDYDFNQDDFVPSFDDINKRKLAYRHRAISQKYRKVAIVNVRIELIICCVRIRLQERHIYRQQPAIRSTKTPIGLI